MYRSLYYPWGKKRTAPSVWALKMSNRANTRPRSPPVGMVTRARMYRSLYYSWDKQRTGPSLWSREKSRDWKSSKLVMWICFSFVNPFSFRTHSKLSQDLESCCRTWRTRRCTDHVEQGGRMLSNQRGGNFLIVGLFLQTLFFASFHFPVFLFVIS